MTVLLNAALHARARLVIMPSFDLAKFLGNIAEPQVHVSRSSRRRSPWRWPSIRWSSDYDLSSPASASCRVPHRWTRTSGRRSRTRLGCRVVQGYGMSELSPVSHITPFDGGRD